MFGKFIPQMGTIETCAKSLKQSKFYFKRAGSKLSQDNNNNNNNGRNGSCLTWLATSLEEKRRWLVINASPRGQCSK